MRFQTSIKTEINFGQGSIECLKSYYTSSDRILLCYGSTSIKANGLYNEVTALLKEIGVEFVELSGIKANPELQSVEEGLNLIKENNLTHILAVGGGSVIDAAKAIAMTAPTEFEAWEVITKPLGLKTKMPLGCILTLAATGSEANANFVVTNEKTKVKFGNRYPGVSHPDFAVLDPKNTLSVPLNQTVNGIIDTLAHLLEQYFHAFDGEIVADICDDRIAYYINRMLECGSLLVDDLHNIKLREEMMYIACKALDNEFRTTVNGDWASHLITYPLGGELDLAHGEALAMILPTWMEYVKDRKEDKFNKLEAQTTLTPKSFRDFCRMVGARTSLDFANLDDVTIERYADIILNGNTQIGAYYKLEKQDIINIIKKASK